MHNGDDLVTIIILMGTMCAGGQKHCEDPEADTNHRVFLLIGDKSCRISPARISFNVMPEAPKPPTPENRDTEDARFIAFAKENIGLLASVASVPLLSSAVGALKPPANMDELTIVASLISVIAFGACFALRAPFGLAARHRHVVVKAIPGMICLAILVLGAYVTAEYLRAEAALQPPKSVASAVDANPPGAPTQILDSPKPIPPKKTILLFLSIYPLFIFALGIILVTSFTMQAAHDIQAVIEQRLADQTDVLLQRLQLTARFYEIGREKGKEKFLKIGEELINDRNQVLNYLSQGIIEARSMDAMKLQRVLVENFKNSFDAVSYGDLLFWNSVGTEAFAREYFQLNLEALKRSANVTRLIILDGGEVETPELIRSALELHETNGIGWAVAIYDELDPSTRATDDDIALDFGLYDDEEVAIYFRDYQNGNDRKLRAVFAPDPSRPDAVKLQRQRYLDLAGQCWLVSTAFMKRLSLLPGAELLELKKRILGNSAVTARRLSLPTCDQFAERLKIVGTRPNEVALNDCFLFPVSDSSGIAPAVDSACGILAQWRHVRAPHK